MKVDLDELKKGVEKELQNLEKRRSMLVQSLDQIKAVESLVKGHRPSGETEEEEESAGFQLSRLSQFRDVLGNRKEEDSEKSEKKESAPSESGAENEKDVNIEWIETG